MYQYQFPVCMVSKAFQLSPHFFQDSYHRKNTVDHCFWRRCVYCHCTHRIGFYWLDINSSPPNATYMRQWTGSTLVQVIACCLFGTKPLPEPMLSYCQLYLYKQTSVKFESIYKTYNSWKCTWKCLLWNGDHFFQRRWVNIDLVQHWFR